MSEIVTTFCDYCNREQDRRTDGRGWAEWSQDHCFFELDWAMDGVRIKCPQCQKEDGICAAH